MSFGPRSSPQETEREGVHAIEPSERISTKRLEEMEETELHEEREKVAEHIVETLNPSGRYQYRIYWLSIPIMVATAYLVILISYVSPDPFAECESPDQPGQYSTCTEQEACDLRGMSLGSRIYFDIECWPKEFDIICDKASQRSQGLMLLLFINTSLSSLVLALSDRWGRMYGWYVSLGMATVGSLISIFVPNYFAKMAGFGIANASAISYAVLLTIMIEENTTSKTSLRSTTVGSFFLGYGLGTFIINLFAFISTSPTFLIVVTLATFYVFGVPCFFLFKETPMFLLDKKDHEGFQRVIKEIGVVNGCKVEEHCLWEERLDSLKEINMFISIEEKKRRQKGWREKSAVTRLLFDKRYLFNLTVLCLIGGYLYSIYYGMSVNIQELGIRDIRINGLIFGATQTIAYICVVPFVSKMKRMKWSFLFQLMMMAGAVLLLIIGFAFPEKNKSFPVLLTQSIIASIFCGGGLSALFPIFFMYISELHPVELRGTASSLVLFVSNCISIGIPFLATASAKIGIHFMVGCSLVGLISIPLTCRLRETLA